MNGNRAVSDMLLKPGDEVKYYMTSAQERKPAYQLLFEDENIVVLDKESGVNSEAVFCETGLLPIHRLDRNTAGCMILAKNTFAEEELLLSFRERRVIKIYHALVAGKMEKNHDLVRAKLQKGADRVVIGDRGETIITEYEVLEERMNSSLLKITLHTGKTHQIRAHMAYLGHPVLGDQKYGDFVLNRKLHLKRQQLIAKSLTLESRGILSYLSGKTFLSSRTLTFPQDLVS